MIRCNRMTSLALAMGALMLVAAPAAAGDIAVQSPWSRATAEGAETGAVYMTIQNSGAADQLLDVQTPLAERVEIHVTIMDGPAMAMRPIEGPLPIPAGGQTALAPMGTHLMLIGLKQRLVEGESFPMTLKFQGAGTVEANVAIAAPGASSAP